MGQQIRITVFALTACAACAQNALSFQGETTLKTQFIDVQPDVKLEVLDWGGTGRNLVLLAGLGSTAHVFDSLGPKLAAHYHVSGNANERSAAPRTLENKEKAISVAADRALIDVLLADTDFGDGMCHPRSI